MDALIPATVALPLFVAAVLAAVGRWIPRGLSDAAGIGTTLASGAAAALLAVRSGERPIAYWFGGHVPDRGVAVGIPFVVEPLGAGMVALTAVLAAAGLVFSIRYFDTYEAHFHALVLVFLAAVAGFALTADVFDMFVFFELMSATSIALTGYKSRERGPIEGAIAFGVTETVALFFFLVGIALLYGRTGSLNMAEIGRALGPADAPVVIAFALMVAGCFVKAAIAPFHLWLADAHAVAPTPASVLFSGVMVEAGLFGVLRLYGWVFRDALLSHEAALRTLLVVVGAFSAVLGGIMCLLQRHLKRLLAFSTVSHVGVMLLGLGLLDGDAVGGVAVYVLGHGLAKAALFLGVGAVLHRLGSVDEIALFGKGARVRALSLVFFGGALALAGVVPFGTGRGEHAIETAAEHLGRGWIRVPVVLSAALTSAAVVRATLRVFFGVGTRESTGPEAGGENSEAQETEHGSDGLPALMWIVPAVLLAGSLASGVLPSLAAGASAAAPGALDARRFSAWLLAGGAAPGAALAEPASPSPWTGIAALSLGALVAAMTLYPRHRPSRILGPAARLLRASQSGRATDYVVWIVWGTAAFAVACLASTTLLLGVAPGP